MNEKMRKENEGKKAQNVVKVESSFAGGTNDFLFHVIRCQMYCVKKRNNLYILNHP